MMRVQRVRTLCGCALASFRRHGTWLGLWGVGIATIAAACSFDSEQGTGSSEQNRGVVRSSVVQAIQLSFQDGASPYPSYAGTSDATISSSSPNRKFGGFNTCTSRSGSGGQSCLLRWDVSAIPTGSYVEDASITLWAGKVSSGIHGIFQLKRDWTESQVTWINADAVTPWGTPGALSPEDRGPQVGAWSEGLGFHTVPIAAALVQLWVNGEPNHGVIVSANGPGNLVVASSENGAVLNRPRLNVTYLPCDPMGCNTSTVSTTGAGGSGPG